MSFFAGPARTAEPRDTALGLQVSYTRDLAPHFFLGASYLNEGHIPGHHRDGLAAKIGVQTDRLEPGLQLRASLGPYHYFDTTVAENPAGFTNAHDWAVLYSLAARWRPAASRWTYELELMHVETRHGFDSTMLLAGVGYHFDQDPSRESLPAQIRGADNEVNVMLGQTIVNSLESENHHSLAGSVEYRRRFGPLLRASIGWTNEGDARLVRRNGIVAQAWLEPTFESGRFSLGLGYGPYFSVDSHQGNERDVLQMLSATASYRFARSWTARLTWHRCITHNDRDSDILLVGAGYLF